MDSHNTSKFATLNPDDPILGRGYPKVASTIHVAIERLYRLLRDDLGKLLKDNGNLRLQDWRILTVLFANGWMAQKDILDLVMMEQAQVSRALTSLQENGLVLAERSKADRRVWLFALSESGQALYDRLLPMAMARRQRIDASLEAAEKEALFELLRKIAAATETS